MHPIAPPLLSLACRNLAQAFADDPFYRAILPGCGDAPARSRLLEPYFALALDEARQSGRIDLSDEQASGCAIWSGGADAALTAAARARRRAALPALLGERGYANYLAIIAGMDANMAPHHVDGAWYLSIAAIHPATQGRGHGSRLLACGLAAVDRAAVACYLETYTERNLAFYARLGFGVAGRYHEPVSGADYWLMSRPARG